MEILSKEIHADVTAIKIYDNYIFCGIGSYLKLFKYHPKQERIYCQRIFNGSVIFQLVLDTDNKQLLAIGEKHLKVFSIVKEQELSLQELSTAISNDWVLAGRFIPSSDNYILTMTMQNTANLWQVKPKEMVLLRTFSCNENCILYSAFIDYDCHFQRCIFFAGTVFNTVLLWSCQLLMDKHCDPQIINVSKELVGHEGVIFSIDYKDDFICTTSDDRSSILWQLDGDEIKQICRVYGHLARVFCCKIMHESFVTAGEDGLINIWSPNGNLIKKLIVNQEGQLWQLDYCFKQKLLGIGSGNGALTLLNLNKLVNNEKLAVEKLEIHLKSTKVPKLVRFININNVFYILCISIEGTLFLYENSREIVSIPHLDLGTSILMEIYQNFIALAGQKGHIYIYQLITLNKSIEIKNVAEFNSKINHFDRLASLHWLTDKLLLICTQNGHLTLIYCNQNQMVVIGNYLLPKSKERWSTCACFVNIKYFLIGDRRGYVHLFNFPNRRQNPIQSYKVHNYLGVSTIFKSNNLIATTGRDGFIKYLKIVDNIKEITANQMPFNWLTQLYETNNIIVGFQGKQFIIYDYKERRILFEWDCGGGHRSWDSFLKNNFLHFVYIKNKLMYFIQYDLNVQNTIIGSWHANVVNCLVAFPFNNNFYISGGEDTTIRLSKLHSNEFHQLQITKSHLSSVRCLVTKLVDQNTCYAVSGGGRAQIIFWKVHFSNNNCQIELISSFYEENVDESETRIMDIAFLDLNCIVAVSSDGTIKIFQLLFNDNKQILSLVHSEKYRNRKCILKCHTFSINNRNYLITCSTDGILMFWEIFNYKWAIKEVKTFYLHQSGINSCGLKLFKCDLIGILTGGDDNSIHFTIFQLLDKEFIIVNQFSDNSTHCAQISSCFIHLFKLSSEGLIYTVSKDQKLAVFKWQLDFETKTLQCNKLISYYSCIADTEGLQISHNENDKLQAVIYGRGIEFLDLTDAFNFNKL